jgi:hypothetical protein
LHPHSDECGDEARWDTHAFQLRAEVTVSRAYAMVVVAIATVVGCGSGGDGPVGQTTSRAATPLPLSWTVSTWFVDPANSTGAANDGNPCVASTAPCQTYQGIAAKWGTYSPRLRQDTTITFLSSHSDDADPVYFSPLIEHGATVSIQGVLGPAQQVAAGTLSNVVPKNRAAGQLLAATLPAGAAAGQLVVNTTHAGRAWVYQSAGGTNWLLSQPQAPVTVPGTRNLVEVDSWANGDSIALYHLVAVNIAAAAPTLADTTGLFNNLTFYQLAVLAPPNDVFAPLTISTSVNVFFFETSIQRVLQMNPADTDLVPEIGNADLANNVLAGLTEPAAQLLIAGGQIRSPALFANLRGANLTGDAILGVPCNVEAGAYGSVFLGAGATLSVTEATMFPANSVGQGTTAIWGTGALNVMGNARLEYFAGANQAQAIFLNTGGLQINGNSTACSVDTSSAGNWRCGIPITAGNLDGPVSAGGFGGNAVNPGGAAISNVSGF